MVVLDHDRLNRYHLLAQGNFHPYDLTSTSVDDEDDPTKKKLLAAGADVDKDNDRQDPGSSEAICGWNGCVVRVDDYHVNWVGNGDDNQMTTHEVTYDEASADVQHVYVSGFSTNQMARISMTDPTQQQYFRFELPKTSAYENRTAVPHTLRFRRSTPGKLWVGLEYASLIVCVDIPTILQAYDEQVGAGGRGRALVLDESFYEVALDVSLQGNPSIPIPIETHPHGFCFDQTEENIWFTGKLTNTVGVVNIATKKVQHFELPTLGAVPIYVALDNQGNVWGTCLANNLVFRVCTGTVPGETLGQVMEIPITPYVANSRPIVIKPDPRHGKNYMWFSNEAGHSICRINVDELNRRLGERPKKKLSSTSTCMCSSGCKKIYKAPGKLDGVIIQFPIPRANSNMIGAGLAFDREHNLWFQSYYDVSNGRINAPFPYDAIVQIKESALDRDNLEGVPTCTFRVPTKRSILHRIIAGSQPGQMFFTELGSNRLGRVTVTPPGTPWGAPAAVTATDVVSPAVPPRPAVGTSVSANDDAIEPTVQLIAPTPVDTKASVASKDADATQIIAAPETFFRVGDVQVREGQGKVIASSKKVLVWTFVSSRETSQKHTVQLGYSTRRNLTIKMDDQVVWKSQGPTVKQGGPIGYVWTYAPQKWRMEIRATPGARPGVALHSGVSYQLWINDHSFLEMAPLSA